MVLIRSTRAVSYTHLDVYKRQILSSPVTLTVPPVRLSIFKISLMVVVLPEPFGPIKPIIYPVSYTHLDVYKRQGLFQLQQKFFCPVHPMIFT